MLHGFAMAAAGYEEPSGDGPDALPTELAVYHYEGKYGTCVGLSWVTGDKAAHTRMAYDEDEDADPPSNVCGTVSPGATLMETEKKVSDDYYFWIRHEKNGEVGDWVGSVGSTLE